MRMKIFSAFWFYPIFGLKQKPNIIFLLVDDLGSELAKKLILVLLEIWIVTKFNSMKKLFNSAQGGQMLAGIIRWYLQHHLWISKSFKVQSYFLENQISDSC